MRLTLAVLCMASTGCREDCGEEGNLRELRASGCTQATSDGFYAGYQAGLDCGPVPAAEGALGYQRGANAVCPPICTRQPDGTQNPCEPAWKEGYLQCYAPSAEEGEQAGREAAGCD